MAVPVAIVIPTKDRSEELKRALDSIYRQISPPDEIVVVDDGSRIAVSAADIFRECPAGIATILLRNEVSKGANACRNLGLGASRSEYVAFLDDDDQFLPEKIENVRLFIEKVRPQIITQGAIVNVENFGISYRIKPKNRPSLEDHLIRNVVGTTSMVTVKRMSFLDIGGFDESLSARQDYEAWLRCFTNGFSVHATDGAMCIINISLSKESISKNLDNIHSALEQIELKYVRAINKLSENKRHRRRVAISEYVVHKYMLGGDIKNCAVYCFRRAITYRSIRLGLLCIAVLLGQRTFFRLFSLRSK